MARILVIDDERQIRETVQRILERDGHTVQVAENGKIGVKLFRENPSDLVITDILMPGQDGFDTIKILKKEFPKIPIIAISGGAPALKAQFGLEAAEIFGASRILAKPLAKADLLAAVSEVLAKS